MEEVIEKLIPPQGIHRRQNVEGSELLDCDGDELEPALEEELLDDEGDASNVEMV